MRPLNPTLWRTCRMLSGHTRIRLLRHLLEQPGQTVTQLASASGIGVSDSSQELRRIQSRGLLQVERKGSCAIYHPVPDPQVPSAAPLLKALKTTLAKTDAGEDDLLLRIATALAYPRRVAIAKALLSGPRVPADLAQDMQTSPQILNRHVRILAQGGFIRRRGRQVELATPSHPLARALVRLLRQ